MPIGSPSPGSTPTAQSASLGRLHTPAQKKPPGADLEEADKATQAILKMLRGVDEWETAKPAKGLGPETPKPESESRAGTTSALHSDVAHAMRSLAIRG